MTAGSEVSRCESIAKMTSAPNASTKNFVASSMFGTVTPMWSIARTVVMRPANRSCQPTSICDECVSGDVRGGIRREERDDGGDLAGLREAPHWVFLGDDARSLILRQHRPDEIGSDGFGRNGVHAHATVGYL